MNDYKLEPGNEIAGDLGNKLKLMTSGCRLSVSSVGCKRKLTEEQRQKMADAFSAEVGSVSANRQTINRRLDVVRPLFLALSRARAVWSDHTIKYEDGVRLIRTDRIAWMNQEIAKCQAELKAAAQVMYAAWHQVKEDAAARLVDLYVEEDYDFDIRNECSLLIEYPAIEPDNRLKEIAPELYEAEHARIRAQFREAAIAAEEALQAEFQKLLDGLFSKLTESTDAGKKKVVQQRAIDALVDFATRFESMSVSGNESLQSLVMQAKSLAGETTIKSLKEDDGRENFVSELSEIRKSLEAFVVAAPNRSFELEA